MSTQSLKQLDERIKQLKVRDLVDMNLLTRKNKIMQETRGLSLYFIVAGTITLLTTYSKLADGSIGDRVYFVLIILIILSSLWALIRGRKTALLAVAFAASLIGIYDLILINIFDNQFHIVKIIVGAINILFALFYIQQANEYEALENYPIQQSDSNKMLYQDVIKTLSSEKPDKTNNLIILQGLRQEITVWLRSSFVVIYLHHEKRLFFDTNRTFELVINGKDTGGDKINVLASIIDNKRSCSISRYDWLRYIQFAP